MSKNKWDERFSNAQYIYGKTPNEFIRTKSNFLPDHVKVGCFAEGEGRNAVYLATRGHDVTAYDLSTTGLEKTKQLAAECDVIVDTVAMDLTTDYVEKAQFDAAVMVFGHVPKEKQRFFIENIVDSVTSGGYVMLEVYSDQQLEYKTGGPQAIDMLYRPTDLLEWLKPYKFLHFYYGEATRHEGSGHTGLGHVIQVVIQK